MRPQRLFINIDHVATIRQARRGIEPDPVAAAVLCERAGADGITAHLREDRRHIQDPDIEHLVRQTKGVFNLEMACTAEMLDIALRLKPSQATLVPEKRTEVTTEGGLDLLRVGERASRRHQAAHRCRDHLQLVHRSHGGRGRTRRATSARRRSSSIRVGTRTTVMTRRRSMPFEPRPGAASEIGLAVDAGHGLTVSNVGPVAAIPEIGAMNIGHSVISRAIFIGITEAVRELRSAMDAARHPV